MNKRLTAALRAASMMLDSCATMSTGHAAHIESAINRSQAAYDRLGSTAELVLPFLSPERAARALGNVAGGTQYTGSAVCSNGSGATGCVEAGRRYNSHN